MFDEYQDELEIIKEEFDTERSIMVDQHNSEMNDIADILFAMEQNFQERESEAKSEFQSMRDEIKNKVTFYRFFPLSAYVLLSTTFNLFPHTTILQQTTLKTCRQKYGIPQKKKLNFLKRFKNLVAKGEIAHYE